MDRATAHETYLKAVNACPDAESKRLVMRKLCQEDLFYLLVYGCGRLDADRDWIYDRCREVELHPNGHVDLWARFHYKAVDVNEPVLTTTGWKEHGNLNIGDKVFGFDGKPISVIAKTPVFTDADCYRVTFCTGYSVVVSGEHLWSVWVQDRRRVDKSNTRVGSKDVTLNTVELREQVLKSISVPTRIYPRVKMPSAVSGGSVKPFYSPYAIGVWLGDGTTGNNHITSSIQDADEMESLLVAEGIDTKRATHSNAVTIVLSPGIRGKRGTSAFSSIMRERGILTAKRMPDDVMFWSIEDRWALLQGLMDTDGSCHKEHSQAIFCNANPKLAKDVYILACSLGLKATFAKRSGLYRGERRPFWQVQFKATAARPPFRLSRKVALCSKSHDRQTLYKRVQSVERVDTIPVSCIQVDAKDGLYLIGYEFTPTHNSTIQTFAKTIQDILNHPDWTFGIFSHTRPIAKGFLRQIKREFECNDFLKWLFPDILYARPDQESLKWSLAIDTPVLTVNGWKRHGDLVPGDRIYGSDGKVITVIGNSGITNDVKCYRVVFDDTEIIASGEHLWPVEYKKFTCNKWDDAKIKTFQTTELKAKTKVMRMLPTPVVDIRQSGDLPVDPYILGLWLGDGTIGTNIISMHNDDEEELLGLFAASGYEYYIHRKKPEDNFSMYGLRGLKEQIEKLGCLRDKHIPEQYLFSNIENRRALLQGLMDSDGTCKKLTKTRSQGMCMFSNTNTNLADGMFFLATSLGFRPSRLSFMPKQRCRKIGNHVYFVGVKSLRPFRLSRKLANCKDARVKVARYFKYIEEVPSVPVNCIKVDAKDSLYLAGTSMVPTHNSEDDGVIVKRKSNPKESTIEAWGLVDGQPTSRHFDVMIYDDVVTLESVSTPEMINKTTKAWEISLNLLSEKGVSRYVGTRYHFSDTYKTIIEREAAIPRIHTATDDGTFSGNPVLITKQKLTDLIKRMGSFTASCQLFLDPLMDDVQRFDPKWVRYWTEADASRMNIYLLVDPANDKKKKSDYTAMFVVGVDEKDDYYILDMVRDRLNLTERADKLFELHKQWKPIRVGYEKYGMQADIEHFKDKMEQDSYYFGIEALGGNTAKFDRIRRLVPLFESGRIFLPKVFVKKTYEGVNQDLVSAFVDQEYKAFPFGAHDDMMDCLARITDENMAVFPTKYDEFKLKPLSTILIDSLSKKQPDEEFGDYVASEVDAYERAMGFGHRDMELIYDRV